METIISLTTAQTSFNLSSFQGTRHSVEFQIKIKGYNPISVHTYYENTDTIMFSRLNDEHKLVHFKVGKEHIESIKIFYNKSEIQNIKF